MREAPIHHHKKNYTYKSAKKNKIPYLCTQN